MKQVFFFPGTVEAPTDEVGGKGQSLIRMIEAGLPVPPGAILTTGFFAPWFEVIQSSLEWAALFRTSGEERGRLCQHLKSLCPGLTLTTSQRSTLEEIRSHLSAMSKNRLFAVRSSSPEEDLASASFAGGYETRLGVRLADLEDALRTCFASSLDERVLIYKEAQGFDIRNPRIAVVVQQQIDSEVAGVGFSLNPISNDYDEAVINANWGLGESVVAGLVSPDHFVVDKVRRQILQETVGAKQVSIWLQSNGGTQERKAHRPGEPCLSHAQVLELTALICRIEELYDKPMDIEWAYGENQLYLLQARPITTYVPVPAAMLTKPGERRRLYIDGALSKGMTTNAPISPMALDWMEDFASSFLQESFGIGVTPQDGLVLFQGGRMYMNFSNVLWLASPEKLAKGTAPQDILMGEILANIDSDRYRAVTRPPWLRLKSLKGVPRLLWRLRELIGHTLWPLLAPQRAHRAYRQRADSYERELAENIDYSLPIAEFRRTYGDLMGKQSFVAMSVFGAAMIALGSVNLIAGKKSPHAQTLAEKLKTGFKDDVVVEMGIELYRMAKLLPPAEFGDLDRLATKVRHRKLSPEFLLTWDAFMLRFGARGPLEMDVVSPRYGDDPRLALRQMSFMNLDDSRYDPGVLHERQMQERFQAYDRLLARSGWVRRVLLRRIHRIIDLFAGTRDTPKHHIVLFQYALRKRLLLEGQRLVREGRLDAAADIFNLNFTDLGAADQNPNLDLRSLQAERTHFIRILEKQVTEFPQVIDSRGRILRPAPGPEKPGELQGMGVSAGIVRGPIKILRDPHEKPIEKGDVLVAYTTDPGWTPLFVNAAAVVLEVGGVLQHGAVVAREYGKPCVVGIDRLMQKVEDHQMVEVDGASGMVRMLTPEEISPDRSNG